MSPWEIWISESQERMTMAVPEDNVEKLLELFAKRGVEATVVGTYTDNGKATLPITVKPLWIWIWTSCMTEIQKRR